MRPIGINYLSVFGLPPVAFVRLAADLGCDHVSTYLEPPAYNPHGYPRFSLRTDPALRRELVAALADTGVSLGLAEGFAVHPDRDVRGLAADLDHMCELGAKIIGTISFETDMGRAFDQIAVLAEMAAARGLPTGVEFSPSRKLGTLALGLEAVRHAGRPECRLIVDTLHLARSGSTAADVAALDPAVVGYIQLADAPLATPNGPYLEEAMYERMAPGTGELPLFDVLSALPPACPIGLEVPLRVQAEAGLGPYERLAPVVEKARDLLARL